MHIKQMQTQVDYGVVTALPMERDAVKSRLHNCRKKRNDTVDIRTYYLGEVPLVSGICYKVVIVLASDMGTVDAVAATGDMIRRWDPKYVIMVGIAGGIPRDGLTLGDVVVSDQVIEYEYAKELPDRQEVRPRVHRADALLLDRARDLSRWSGPVRETRPPGASRIEPRLFIGPIASGNKVVASEQAREKIRALHTRILAVEMEGEGVAAAAWQQPRPKGVLVIRGICDLADMKKRDDWQPYAAAAAATFFIDFLKSEPTRPAGVGEQLSDLAIESLQRAESLVITRSYREAALLLASLAEQFPTNSRVRLLYGLALLGERDPDTLTDSDIKSIESHIVYARLTPETQCLASIVLAIIKHDFYLSNGRDEGMPQLGEILSGITRTPSPSDMTLLKHINATRRIKQLLGLDW